jgi:hypothetical protein
MSNASKRLLMNEPDAPCIYGRRWKRNAAERPRFARFGVTMAFGRPASGMSASGQDPKGLEAKPDSPTAEGGDAQ